MFYRSQLSQSEARSDVSIQHSKSIYNFLQGRSLKLLETNGLDLCVYVCGHAQHMYADITAGSEMGLEIHTEKETQYKSTVCCNKYFSCSIPCCISYPKKVLGLFRKDYCHKQQSSQKQCFFWVSLILLPTVNRNTFRQFCQIHLSLKLVEGLGTEIRQTVRWNS